VTGPYTLDRACTAIFFESRQDGNDPLGDGEGDTYTIEVTVLI
jgi:hypothetical protein